ncbi:MAG TPA: F0F1 ATP synthase subunit alpha, partial [Planctomycetota bacterium]|nr:F0F1 ATP synthase subunit alpha [Planctomycetota bacterium]
MTAIRPEEVSSIISKEIKQYEAELKMESVGVVLQVGDGIARVYGLENVMASELVEFPGGVYGMALNLEEDSVGCVILGEDRGIKEGDTAKCTGRIVEVPVGPAMLGRVVDALGRPIDGKGPIAAKKYRPVEGKSKNVVERQPVKEPLQTGWKAIDAMIPIGRGQRELILGDRQTGKTALTIDTIINQKGTGVVCIYVAVGQKQSTVKAVVERLEQSGAMPYCIVVSAPASAEASMQFLS